MLSEPMIICVYISDNDILGWFFWTDEFRKCTDIMYNHVQFESNSKLKTQIVINRE
jgi:hypothetical protein